MDNKWFTVNTSYEETILNDVKVIRVVKNGKINEFDENTYVKLEIGRASCRERV